MNEPMAIIRAFPNEIEAVFAQTVLDANGIDSELLRDDAGGMIPSLHVIFPVRLIVPAADAERALEILDSSVNEVVEGSDPNT